MTARSIVLPALPNQISIVRTQSTFTLQTATIACWIKQSSAGYLGGAGILECDSSSYFTSFGITNTGQLKYWNISNTNEYWQGGSLPNDQQWHHIVFACDTTQITAADRIKLYIDGNQVTGSGSPPPQNAFIFRAGGAYWFMCQAAWPTGTAWLDDALLDDFYFIDGLQLTPSAFASGSPIGRNPISYSGAFGARGFYLTFDDNTTIATLCADQSGQGNNWTAFSQSATTSTDVPPIGGYLLATTSLAVGAPVITTNPISKETFSILPLTVGSPVLTQPVMSQIGISRLLFSSFSVRNPDIGNPHLLSYSLATLGGNWTKSTNAIVGGKFIDGFTLYGAVALIDKAGAAGPFEISQTVTRPATSSTLYRLTFEVAPTEALSNFEIGLMDNTGGTASAVFEPETGNCLLRKSSSQIFQVLDVAAEPLIRNFIRFILLAQVGSQSTLKGFIRLVNEGSEANFIGSGFRLILVAYPMLLEGNDNRNFRWEIGAPEMRFYWTIHMQDMGLQWFRCSQAQLGIDPHLRFQTALDLSCVLQRWQPAQTQIVFDYSGAKLSGESDPMAGTP